MLTYENGKMKYLDKNGREITKNCRIRYENGDVKVVYLTENGELGTDATNPVWIKNGRSVPCEYGIYPLTEEETNNVQVVN